MVPASVLSEEWLPIVADSPGPYFFVTEGVLVYLPEPEVTQTLARIAARFPGAQVALDTYPQRMHQRQHQLAARRGIAPWQWACGDPASLQRLGLRLDQTTTVTRPPRAMRRDLPPGYRYLLLPLADPIVGRKFATLSLFTADGSARPAQA
jgi:O-methyltransferase involved in polyketide biosynthesis